MTKSSSYFESVEVKINFPEEEHKLLNYWREKEVVKKYLRKNNKSKKYFSFLDGPITANNPMGVHHAWGRTYKDLWQRFKNMKGFRERFQNGFDAQGLWVEVEVEKELGFKNKKDIEKFGIEKFVNLCKERVKKYSQIQTEQSKRLGYFMDWDNSYYTLSEDNNYMIWHFLKVVNDNGWLYKGNDSVPWCPRCETAISQHEMLTEDYKEVTHESIFLSFPIVGHDKEYLLVWTTTPWTIPANIAVAVDAKLDYAKVQVGESSYWIAKDAVERVFRGEKYKILKATKGEKLIGWKYKGAFDNLPKVSELIKKKDDKFHTVIATDNLIMPITTTEGTGLVHTAVSAGTEDFRLGQKLGLPMIPVIKDDASYLDGLGELSGENAKKNPKIIINFLESLKSEGSEYYLKVENYTHRYPACWRCKTELVWKVTDEWYISMDKPSVLKTEGAENTKTLRARMIDVTKKINWLPSFGLDRELDWLNNMHDWLISKKNRYWGLALPIWECEKCGRFDVVGGKEELKNKTIEGWEKFEGKTPHKPQIDQIKLKCSSCGSIMSRIEPVGNPWLDAGIVPYSTISDNNNACNFENTDTKPLYTEKVKNWKKWFPPDFITESFPGQFKNWFYSMIAMSTVLENENPFKTVLGYATLLAEDGRPMHKSWGNSIEFNEGADKIGVDVMRWMYVRQNPAENILFGYRIADETRRRFHLKLWNIYNFFITYANLDQWNPKINASSTKSNNLLDTWILARLNQTVLKVTESLEKYDAYTGSLEIEKFVDDLSLWYIRRSRSRVGPGASSDKDRTSFYQTTYLVLVTLSKLLAPFNPFISDMVYRNLSKKLSVHLEDWPKTKSLTDSEIGLIKDMQILREKIEGIHAERKEKQIPVRQPLSSLYVFFPDESEYWGGMTDLVAEELNIKKVIFKKNEDVEKDGKLKKYLKQGYYLDTTITPELEEEARARELIRKIQSERKELGVGLDEKVSVTNDWLPGDSNLLDWITKKAQVSNFTKGIFKVNITPK